MYKKYSIQGFSLIEILAVIAIILILIGLLYPALNSARIQAKRQEARSMIGSIEVAINMFFSDTGVYPADDTLTQLINDPGGINGWAGPYMDTDEDFKDPWETAYQYSQLDGTVTLISYGADGVEGGEGKDKDITN